MVTFFRKSFKNIRLLMYTLIYVGYMVYYIGRQGFWFALPWLSKELDITLAQTGLFTTIFTVSYGISKLFGGLVVDKFNNSGLVMGVGLLGAGLINLSIGAIHDYYSLVLLVGLHGVLQAFGWPPCSKVLSNWFSDEERGSYWSIWSTSYAVGETIAPWIVQYFLIKYSGWRMALVNISFLCMIVALILALFLRDSPKAFEFDNLKRKKISKKTSIQQVFFTVVSNRRIVVLSFGYFLVQFVRTALSSWLVFHIVNSYHSGHLASLCLSVFSLMGAIALPVWGRVADMVYKKLNTRIPVPFYCLLALSGLMVFWGLSYNLHLPYIEIFASACAGVLIFSPQMLTGIIAVDVTGEEVAGTVTGFVGLVAYLGSAMAGVPLGFVIGMFGWHLYFYIIASASLLGAFVYHSLLVMHKNSI